MVIALETGEHVQHSYQKNVDSNQNQITSAVQQHSHYYRQSNHVRMCMPCDQARKYLETIKQ